MDALERFWSKVDIKSEDECWLWKAGIGSKGYGNFSYLGKTVTASKFSYEITYGSTNGLLVCHHCDTPACVNPKHLYLGTVKQNAKDMIERNRGRKPTGKWSLEVRTEISQLRSQGWTQQAIATKFGTSQGAISNILLGRQ